MFNFIDNILNRITMYRLVLYYLIALLIVAIVFGALKIMPNSPLSIVESVALITFFCWVANEVSARLFHVPTNVESVYITALILALIVSPIKSFDITSVVFVFWVCVLAMSSKYIFAMYRKHTFNPVALAVAVTGFAIGQGASWWVGTGVMMPFVLVGGILMVRKLRHTDLVLSFFAVALITIVAFDISNGVNLITSLQRVILNSALLFFAFVMLTEPLTTPPTKWLRICYGVLTGFLFAPQIHILSLYSTPELALLAGNIFSYIVSPKKKLLLTLRKKVRLSPSSFDFIFSPDTKMRFTPGQYMEWTLQHNGPDARGNRRYFTIASSPTEQQIIMGVKFYDPPSTFKRALFELMPGGKILAGQLAGDFVLPKDPNEKLVFIAGGIGITPFRSILRFLTDTKQKRNIIVFYSAKNLQEFVYTNILDDAVRAVGIKVVYIIDNAEAAPSDWQGKVGRIDLAMIQEEVPDYKQRTFYISGPQGMVTAFEETLSGMGIRRSKIKSDFFPGFA